MPKSMSRRASMYKKPMKDEMKGGKKKPPMKNKKC